MFILDNRASLKQFPKRLTSRWSITGSSFVFLSHSLSSSLKAFGIWISQDKPTMNQSKKSAKDGIAIKNLRITGFAYKENESKFLSWRSPFSFSFAILLLLSVFSTFIEFRTTFDGPLISCVETHVFTVRLLQLLWFDPTYLISLKIQLHAVNACWKRVSQCSFKHSDI